MSETANRRNVQVGRIRGSERRLAMTGRGARRAAIITLALSAGAVNTGCMETDGWLWDPSVVGRWEHTPTVVPILERIDIIEQDTGQFVDATQVMPEDLIPEPRDYRASPGDFVRVEIFGFLEGEAPGLYERVVDSLGNIEIPQIGRVRIAGLTGPQAQEAVAQAIQDAEIQQDPIVSVIIQGQRQATFSIFGAVAATGRYQITGPEYRLLDAVTDAGGISPTIPSVYVIRQVPLSDTVERGYQPGPEPLPVPSGSGSSDPKPGGEDILELIEELTAPEDENSSGLLSMSVVPSGRQTQPTARRTQTAAPTALQRQDGQEPIIDLPDDSGESSSPAGPAPPAMTPGSPGRWMFLDGRWVRVTSVPDQPGDEGLPEEADPLASAGDAGDLVTQRVIEIPTTPLLQGVARYNIVIRPGDVISVPSPAQGLVYVGGPGIARDGVYGLPQNGRLTLMRAITAAGGLSAVAHPERVDLVRRIGSAQQAMIRLNLRAIYEGTQPDIYLKPDDMVNVGTSFWMTPLAVVRNGFRTTYGFGFLLDRNFGNDVFGAPPTNRQGF